VKEINAFPLFARSSKPVYLTIRIQLDGGYIPTKPFCQEASGQQGPHQSPEPHSLFHPKLEGACLQKRSHSVLYLRLHGLGFEWEECEGYMLVLVAFYVLKSWL
jgi:hypothetical protein